jgi:hypothetical protein
MRAFVGTLECGEAEFEACCRSIYGQVGFIDDPRGDASDCIPLHISHHIVRGMPEAEAHRNLYDRWNEVRHDHDIFVKVDADTVLADPHVLATIWKGLRKDAAVTGLQLWLDDYYTMTRIPGLNVHRSCVRFGQAQSALVPDRCELTTDDGSPVNTLLLDEATGLTKGCNPVHPLEGLASAGMHCLQPNRDQAYRYGFHRGKKDQWDKERLTLEAYQRHGGDGRKWALEGFRDARNRP